MLLSKVKKISASPLPFSDKSNNCTLCYVPPPSVWLDLFLKIALKQLYRVISFLENS